VKIHRPLLLGVRALAELRGLFLKAGVDYDFQRENASFILALTAPLRRGGILSYGQITVLLAKRK
jgi:hypothetical protein